MTDETIHTLIRDHRDRRRPILQRRLDYFEGRTRSGLPRRLTDGPREIVLENDIAWRLHTMVDLILGRPVAIRAEGPRRDEIEAALDEVFERSGGIAFLQDAATLAHVHGRVPILIRHDDSPLGVRLDLVDPRHAIPLDDGGLIIDVVRTDPGRPPVETIEVIEPSRHRRFEAGTLVHDGPGLLGGLSPVVLLRNLSDPLSHDGLSDVEPLIGLQDELNTRLSDRANRVTMQAFRMLLAKGIEGPESLPVEPGTVWRTWNPDADVRAIGGDAPAPSEERHIQDIREALDKVSAIPPLAGGVVQGRIGNL
ncbi:MAG: phage portal protein, partial [Phycisphaerales bacterium]|nr:phage portal protein [Phycisphaerales bacterium]